MSHAESEGDLLGGNVAPDLKVSMSDNPLSVSYSDLVKEQQADSSLKELFDSVLSAEEARSAANGYFLQDGLLVRKWVPQ